MQKYKINTLPTSERAKQRKIVNGTTDSPISRAEVFCLNTVIQALSSAGIKPESERYVQISRAAARLVIRNRSGIVTRYQLSKEGLKDWTLWKVGLRRNATFERMQRMGLTGDVLHDMEILGCVNVR